MRVGICVLMTREIYKRLVHGFEVLVGYVLLGFQQKNAILTIINRDNCVSDQRRICTMGFCIRF